MMYVLEVARPEAYRVASSCAQYYEYAEQHPRHRTHMQCLRLFGGYRVPVVEGWAHCTAEKSAEQNAAFKAMLFRPYTSRDWEKGQRTEVLDANRQVAASWPTAVDSAVGVA